MAEERGTGRLRQKRGATASPALCRRAGCSREQGANTHTPGARLKRGTSYATRGRLLRRAGCVHGCPGGQQRTCDALSTDLMAAVMSSGSVVPVSPGWTPEFVAMAESSLQHGHPTYD